MTDVKEAYKETYCVYCKAAKSTARLWNLKCATKTHVFKRHKFVEKVDK